MNRHLIHIIFGVALISCATLSEANETSSPEDKTVSAAVSYKLGYQFGQQFAVSFRGFSVDDVDPEYFALGLRDGINRKTASDLREDTVAPSLKSYGNKLKKRLADRAIVNAEAGKRFFANLSKENGVQQTESGILYRQIEAGGEEKYSEETHGESPKFHVVYKGTLIDGTVFDETTTPLIFSTSNMKPGLAEVLKTMPVGAKWHVAIPSELAYGEDGPGIIGPNSPLIFDIKLIRIEKSPHLTPNKENN